MKLVTEQGLSASEAARNLDIGANLLRRWKSKFENESEDSSLGDNERVELARLRAENKRLRMERDILKKATAFFASEKP